jgi:GT2 family glycosyltransferase
VRIASPIAAVVAIPVRDEEARIHDCLAALARQEGGPPDAVVLLLNNCTDRTREVVEGIVPDFPARLCVATHDFAPREASAGLARAIAMDLAADLAGPGGWLLTTDADGRVAPDWLAATRRAFRAGADAVAGRALIDPVEALLIPQSLHDDDARECAYGALLDEIASLLDPDPADPWPRHSEASGASLAVTADWYRRIGGMPRLRAGEDRALVAALRRHDARVRHAPDVRVTVSGRIEGRAPGGMAETIRRRLTCPDAFLDEALEPAGDAARRARLRWRSRALFRAGARASACQAALADLLGLGAEHLAMLMAGHACFGAAWDAVEAASPSLARRRVAVTDLARETRHAERILAELRTGAGVRPAGDPVDSRANDPRVSDPRPIGRRVAIASSR